MEDNQKLFDLWNTLDTEEQKQIYDIFKNEQIDSEKYNSLHSLVFKSKPPSPQEYLDWHNGWLPKKDAEEIFDHVKQDFCDVLSGKYPTICLYGATRSGKTVTSTLLMMYIIIWVHHLRSMAMYYNLRGSSSLAMYLMSFKYDKVYELYLKPLFDLMHKSERFKRVKFQNDVSIIQEKMGTDIIVYSQASMSGEMTLASGLQVVTGNDDALSIIGANILCGFISEIGFFIENAGATEEHIYRLYTDISDRIRATVGKQYLAFTLLDSSANNAESKIENHILNNLRNKDDVMFRWRKRWDVPELVKKFYPIFKKTGETFPICIGDAENPAKILSSEEVSGVPKALIMDVPIDLIKEFEENLIRSIKNIAGQPTTSESKFIQNRRLIYDMFDDNIANIEGVITADSGENPDKLIWNQIVDKFFTPYDGKNYIIKRAQKEGRFIGLDLATSVRGDVVGICMLHGELSKMGKMIYVVDFAFAVGPGPNGINLEAIQCFIRDLVVVGNITVIQVNVDTYQSASLSQFLNRYNIKTIKTSVDTDIAAYLSLYSSMLSGSIKCGRNVFLRNNLDSLYRIGSKEKDKEKIDHSKGSRVNKYAGDYTNSTSGINAKDVSDAVAQAHYAMVEQDILPVTLFEKQQNKTIISTESFHDPIFESEIKDARNVLLRGFNGR